MDAQFLPPSPQKKDEPPAAREKQEQLWEFPEPDSENFPTGSWRSIDYLLHHPRDVVHYIRMDRDLWTISGTLLSFSVLLAAFYGVVMGATNLFQGADMAMSGKMFQIVATSAKVPVLFLFTLAIVLPPIYVSNTFIGSQNSLRQMIALLIAATAITTTALASMGTVAAFFALTSESYHFIKLLHVAVFIYAGVVGLGFLYRGVRYLNTADRIVAPEPLLLIWFFLYAFVGTQLAWILRPFIGTPEKPFELFRNRGGNFYESVFRSLTEFLS